MKKSTVITLIISGTLMLAGAIMVFFGGMNGGMTTICWDKSQHKIVAYDPEKMHTTMDKTKVEPFDSVVVDSLGADIEFIPSDDYYIEYSILAPKQNAMSIENGTLTIDDGNSRYIFISIEKLLYVGDVIDRGYIKIYYPEDADLKLVDIDSDMGDVKADRLCTEKADFDLDMGDISLNGCHMDDADIELDMGDSNISKSNFKDLNAVLSMGSFRMEDSRAEYMNFELEMGDLEVLNSDVTKGLTAELDMGSAELSLYSISDEAAIGDNSVRDYGYTLETEMGEIWVNGKEEGNSANWNGDVIVKIACDMGDIELELH